MIKTAFTIVLNGMPFIAQQYEIIPKVFDKWIIVEGYSKPILDTSWCKEIDTTKFTNNGLSNDGTTEFLNHIASDKIQIIRKPNGDFWNGKTEMCNAAVQGLNNTVLMEFDADEIWDVNTLKSVTDYSIQHFDEFDGMMFFCNCFVGHNLVTVGEDCYGNNPNEWCRLWNVRDISEFITHEPPRMKNLNKILHRNFTKTQGWIFNHYSYLYEKQLKFKEDYYGYTGAVEQWKSLQNNTVFPANLNRFLNWVDNKALVDYFKR
jgi:hypothetical protein